MNGGLFYVQGDTTSKPMLYAGRTLTVLLSLFFLLDAVMKIVKSAPSMEGTMRIGYPASTLAPIGWTLLVCLAFYVIPRTSILGAILLTGYLGGATATMVRISDPKFFFPVIFGILAWVALYLSDAQLRMLIPLRKDS